MNNRLVTFAALLLSIAFVAFGQDNIDQAKLDIQRLTSREFAGRGFILDGNRKASDFLQERFRAIGLKPIAKDFTQSFDLESNVVEHIPRLIVNGRTLILGTDFLPFATTGSGSGGEDAPIYYVKSGLFVPDKNINDFASVKSPNAILIVDEEVPQSIQSDKSIDPRSYARETRTEIAKVLKASAVVFLVKKLSYSTPYERNDFPIFDVLKTSLPVPVQTVSYEVESSFDERESQNIVGVIQGAGSSDSTLMVCAHYDHVGGFSDSLYFPGANDNASGTAMLLSLAQHFAQQPPKHSIVFVAFSGEEAGLVGSKYYSENPLSPLNKTIFLLNLDMVASGDDGVMAVGGDDLPDFYVKLKAVNDSLKLGPLYKRWNAANGDHYFLSKKGVRSFYLYANQGKQPYHSFQDVPSTLDWKAFEHIFRLSKGFLHAIDN